MPLAAILILVTELMGAGEAWLHGLGAALLLGRVLHYLGLSGLVTFLITPHRHGRDARRVSGLTSESAVDQGAASCHAFWVLNRERLRRPQAVRNVVAETGQRAVSPPSSTTRRSPNWIMTNFGLRRAQDTWSFS